MTTYPLAPRAARGIRYFAPLVVLWSVSTSGAQVQPALPAGTLVVLNKSEASVSLLDPTTGAELKRIGVGSGPHEVAVSPDATTAVVCNYEGQGDTLSVIDLPSRAVVRTLTLGDHHGPHGIVYFRDGRHVLVTVEKDQAIVKVDVESGELQAFPTGQQVSHMVAIAPDEGRAFVANIGSGSVSVIDLAGGGQPVIIPTGPGAEGIDVSPDGKEVWVSNRDGHTLSVINAAELKVVQTVDCPVFPIRLKFTPDGAHVLVSCMTSGDLAVFDAATRKEVARIDLREQGGPAPAPIGIMLAPDGKRAFVACSAADKVAVIDTGDWSIVDRFVAGHTPDGLGFADGRPRKLTPR